MVNSVIRGAATKEEAQHVVDWFSSTIEGQQFLSDMLDRDAYLLEADPHVGDSLSPLQSDHLYKKIEKTIYEKRIRRKTFKAAAVLLPLLLMAALGYLFNDHTDMFNETTYAELVVPKGEDARLIFQDGTEVFLNADTRIRYPEKFGLRKREVWIDGEAYFNVNPQHKRPFVVHAHNTRTVVTGTSFNVKAYGDSEKIQVVLDEGRPLSRCCKAATPCFPDNRSNTTRLPAEPRCIIWCALPMHRCGRRMWSISTIRPF